MVDEDGVQARRNIDAQRQRILAMIAVLPVMFAIVTFGFAQFGESDAEGRKLAYTFAGAMVFISLLGFVVMYLQTGFRAEAVGVILKGGSSSLESARISRLAAEVRLARTDLTAARDELKQFVSMGEKLSEPDRVALVANLKAQIQSTATKEIIDDLKAEVGAQHQRSIRDAEIAQLFDGSRNRLLKELDSLGFRGNINLAAGALLAIAGLIVLAVPLFQPVRSHIISSYTDSAMTKGVDGWEFALQYIPRFTLVVFVELFAYFFLALYKTSLAEIKYFQNELTNVEAKQMALRTASEFGDPAAVTAMVNSLAATERNHVLTKDQTTVELEKAKIDREGRGDIVKALQDMIRKKKDE